MTVNRWGEEVPTTQMEQMQEKIDRLERAVCILLTTGHDKQEARELFPEKFRDDDEPTMTYEEMDRLNEYEMWGPAGRPQMPRGGW